MLQIKHFNFHIDAMPMYIELRNCIDPTSQCAHTTCSLDWIKKMPYFFHALACWRRHQPPLPLALSDVILLYHIANYWLPRHHTAIRYKQMFKQFIEQPRDGRANINPKYDSCNRNGHEWNKLMKSNISMKTVADSNSIWVTGSADPLTNSIMTCRPAEYRN